MKRSSLAAAVALGTLAASNAVAYEVDTHADMSRAAGIRSVVLARLPDIGRDQKLFSLASPLQFGDTLFFGQISYTVRRPVLDWMLWGSVREDDYCCPSLRFTNHFYNPLNAQGYSYGIVSGQPSLGWGLEPSDISGQDYSYRDARAYFYAGLTAPTEAQRQSNLSNMFRSMGQVMHLIQDLGQPQHTRNDSHGTGSRYEKYTNDVLIRLAYGAYPTVKVATPDQFWTTTTAPGGGKGLADYTNSNFVTDGTNFGGTRSGNALNITPAPNFPLPNGAGATLLKKQITDPDLLGPVGPNQPLIGEIWFISTTVTDNNEPGLTTVNPRTSTFSIFDEDLTRYGWSWTFTLNRFNFDSAHAFLLPRAVGYSTGMLNYFFRGTMEITPPDDVVWAIIDPTQKSGFQQIKLKLRNTTPNEDMTGGQLWAIAKFHLNTCYQSDLSGEANGPNAPNILACRSPAQGMVTSAPKTVTLAAGAAAQEMSFDFGQTPIPVNATDLFIQFVYRGRLGSEDNAVAAATTDVFEPTHLAFFNGTDVSQINDKFYTFNQVLQGIANGDPTFAPIDRDQDKVYNPSRGDVFVTPFDMSNVPISFVGPSQRVVATIASLPQGRFARMTFLTDRSFVSFFPGTNFFTPPSAFNQVSDDNSTYFVTGVSKLRGNFVTDGDILIWCVANTTCNGKLTDVPPSDAANASTPMQVNVIQQFP